MATPIQLTPSQASVVIEAVTCTIFNEHDKSKRRELMEQHWSKDIVCFSPYGAARGFDAIDQVWEGRLGALLPGV